MTPVIHDAAVRPTRIQLAALSVANALALCRLLVVCVLVLGVLAGVDPRRAYAQATPNRSAVTSNASPRRFRPR